MSALLPPIARIVVECVAKRCMMDRRNEMYEVAVAQGTKVQWCKVAKEVWDSTRVGGTVAVEVLQ